jgi:protein-disulfide isomerase
MHPHAEPAAEAAEAAGAQGQCWAMHEMLFENQQQLAAPYLLAYAKALGLDLARFRSELAEHVHYPEVREDFMSGVRSGVNGTPSFLHQWQAPRWPLGRRDPAGGPAEGSRNAG